MAVETLQDWTIAKALNALAAKDITARDLTEATLAAVRRAEPLNAAILMDEERSLAMADAADARRAQGQAGALEGVPLGIKDIFCVEGLRTTVCSRILDGFVPPYESTVTANLWGSGAVFAAKLNMDEFAMGSSNENTIYGPVTNPWTPVDAATPLVPGGSSGGSAAAVAARAVLGATGTDTGGSIRQPAAFCGIVGLKPTYGRCSRWGIIAFASSLDQAGPMARTVEDAAILQQVMASHDPKDSTSANRPLPDLRAAVHQGQKDGVKGLKIGIPREYQAEGTPQALSDLWHQGAAWLKDQGAEIIEVSLPHTQYALPTYYIVAPAECSSNLARYDGVRYGRRVEGVDLADMYSRTRAEGFGEEVQRRILIGTYVLSAGYYDAYYIKAQQVRTLIARDFSQAFESVDALLTPTAPTPPFPLGSAGDDPVTMYLNDIFTVPASLAGIPGISVPAGLSAEGLPLGLQVLGPAFDEATMLRVAAALEQAAGFTATPPQMV